MDAKKDHANIDAVQRMLSQLRNAFLEDMGEKLDRLENLLLEMENKPAEGELFNEFYRIVHSLKGSGGTLGLHIFTSICHQLEDLLNTTDSGTKFTPPRIEAAFRYVDLLRISCQRAQAGEVDFSGIYNQLNSLRKQLTSKQFTVLLVDHSKLLTSICLEVLSALPVRTVTMSDGPGALMRVLTEPFDLLITSDELPILGGSALIGALKLSNSKNRSINTILITTQKKQAVNRQRVTDPDYIVVKDAALVNALSEITRLALAIGT